MFYWKGNFLYFNIRKHNNLKIACCVNSFPKAGLKLLAQRSWGLSSMCLLTAECLLLTQFTFGPHDQKNFNQICLNCHLDFISPLLSFFKWKLHNSISWEAHSRRWNLIFLYIFEELNAAIDNCDKGAASTTISRKEGCCMRRWSCVPSGSPNCHGDSSELSSRQVHENSLKWCKILIP